MSCEDTVVNDIVQKFLTRSQIGKEKYGTTLDRNDLSTLDWINHAQEELMDGILYLERLKRDFTKTTQYPVYNKDNSHC